ncbi:MAG: mandelate racemase/muconate lactonizing enzyme family protein, partial [Nisaea sp.]
MKIKSVDVIPLQIPFEDGSTGSGLMPTKWTTLEIVLVRIETEDGIVGWGDGFAYSCRRAVAAAIEDMVAPLLVGREIDDIAALNLELQQRLHLHGRYGITMFAISAIDIALWDIAAKHEETSLARLLAVRPRTSLPAYASLMRYAEPDLVRSFAAKAVAEGYKTVKLHEISLDAIKAGRQGAGTETKLATDVNCNWSIEQAHEIIPHMRRLDLYWVEEPVFPPDDAEALGMLQAEYGVAIASGENACTSVEFARTAPH